MPLLLKQKKKLKSLKTKNSSSKSRGKEKEGENSTSEHSDGSENNFRYENTKSSSKEPENSKAEDSHAKRMGALEKLLEAIANQSELQEGGGRSYPVEWNPAPYPHRLKGTDSTHLL